MSVPRWLASKSLWALCAILAVSAYLRLWHIRHLFKWIYDYDEGAYSLGGRFISQGFLPYRDFPLVHPPLYDLLLAGIYKAFGYDFFYGRYLSVFFSLVCVALAYAVVKKLHSTAAGLAAATLFAVFPGFYLLWYRAVQEPLGITLLLGAIWFACDYIRNRSGQRYLGISGMLLGLALATKYTFLPATLGFILGIVVLGIQGRRGLRGVAAALASPAVGLTIAGTVAGFLAVTGYFIIRTPKEFLDQTFLLQIGYRVMNPIDSVVSLLSHMRAGTTTDTVSTCLLCLTLLVPFAAVVFAIIKKRLSRAALFLIVATVAAVPLCALYDPFGEVRYFVSGFIFAIPCVACVTPALNMHTLSSRLGSQLRWANAGLLLTTALLVGSLSGTLVLMRQYNFIRPMMKTYEEEAYAGALQYLHSVGAEKVYGLDPILAALSPSLSSGLSFDTFGLLFVLRLEPDHILRLQLDEGVEYVTIDPFQLLGIRKSEVSGLVRTIVARGTLVHEVLPGDGDAQVPILGISIFKIR